MNTFLNSSMNFWFFLLNMKMFYLISKCIAGMYPMNVVKLQLKCIGIFYLRQALLRRGGTARETPKPARSRLDFILTQFTGLVSHLKPNKQTCLIKGASLPTGHVNMNKRHFWKTYCFFNLRFWSIEA